MKKMLLLAFMIISVAGCLAEDITVICPDDGCAVKLTNVGPLCEYVGLIETYPPWVDYGPTMVIIENVHQQLLKLDKCKGWKKEELLVIATLEYKGKLWKFETVSNCCKHNLEFFMGYVEEDAPTWKSKRSDGTIVDVHDLADISGKTTLSFVVTKVNPLLVKDVTQMSAVELAEALLVSYQYNIADPEHKKMQCKDVFAKAIERVREKIIEHVKKDKELSVQFVEHIKKEYLGDKFKARFEEATDEEKRALGYAVHSMQSDLTEAQLFKRGEYEQIDQMIKPFATEPEKVTCQNVHLVDMSAADTSNGKTISLQDSNNGLLIATGIGLLAVTTVAAGWWVYREYREYRRKKCEYARTLEQQEVEGKERLSR